MYCQKCGTHNSDDANFCYKCGNGLIKIGEVKEEKTIGEVKEEKTIGEVKEEKTIGDVKEEKTNVVQPPKKKVSNWQYLFIILAIIQFLAFFGDSSNGELKYTHLGSGFLFLAIVFALRGSVRLFGISFLSLIFLVVFIVMSGSDTNILSTSIPSPLLYQ